MSHYSEVITITVPVFLADVAAKIGKALDPDVGGDKSFSVDLTDETKLICSTPCSPEFKEQALVMLNDPALLYSACAADYAARWPDDVPPTALECAHFVNSLTLT